MRTSEFINVKDLTLLRASRELLAQANFEGMPHVRQGGMQRRRTRIIKVVEELIQELEFDTHRTLLKDAE